MARSLAYSLIAVAATAPFIARWWVRDFFAPPALVASAWCATFGLYGLQLLPYAELRSDTRDLLLTAIGVLVASSALGLYLGRSDGRPARHPQLHRASVWVFAYAMVGLCGAAWYVTEVVRRLGLRGFRDGAMIRHLLATYDIPSTFLFLQFFCLVAPLLAAALRLTGTRLTPVAWLAAAACAAFTLVSTDRTQAFVLFLSLLFMVSARTGPSRSAWNVAVVGASVLASLLAVFFTVAVWTGKTSDTFGLRLRLPQAEAGTLRGRAQQALQQGAVAYYYATSPYAALNTLLTNPPRPSYGLQTLYPVARLLQRAGVVQRPLPPAILPFVDVLPPGWPPPPPTNVYTFLYYPLQDFGKVGALGYAAIVALICGAVYGRSRTRPESAAWLVATGQCSTGLALSFFVNKFNNTAAVYILVWSLLPFCVQIVRQRFGRTA